MDGIKKEIRIVGFDDCPFAFGQKETSIIGAVFRGGDYLDGVISTKIKIDGLDSTEKIAKVINSSKHKDQLKIIMLDGITFGGFNVVDIQELYKLTGLPVVAVVDHEPNTTLIKKALSKFRDKEKRFDIIKKAGTIKRTVIENNRRKVAIYFQVAGTDRKAAEKIIKLAATRSIKPEPLRIAHLICNGLKEQT